MENNFLAINKEYFKSGLKSIDLLIIAQVEEFQRNKRECFITNKQFSEMFGESESTIKRSLDKLSELGIIKRKTITNGSGSNKSRVRTLTVSKARFKMNLGSNVEQGSNMDEARFKNEESKVHNEPIKEKEKDNKKDNINIDEKLSNEEELELTEEERELLDMNMTTLEEIKEERKQRELEQERKQEEDFSLIINRFYEEEKERLGTEVIFKKTEEGIKSYLGEKCMGHFIF